MSTIHEITTPIEPTQPVPEEIDAAKERVPRRVKSLLLIGLTVSVCLVGFATVTRLRNYSHDSFFYMQVAQRVVQGEGITHTTHDTTELPRIETLRQPLPMTAWTPLYPLLVAVPHAMGMDVGTAAMLVSWLFYAVLLFVMYKLARRTHGEPIALLATAFLTISGSLVFVTTYAWSETTAIAFAALAYYLALRAREASEPRLWLPLLAGVAGGLAFDARYAMLSVAGIAGLTLFESRDWKRSFLRMASYGIGFFLLAGPILVRNAIYVGSPLAGPRPPSDKTLLQNIWDLGGCFTAFVVSSRLIPVPLQLLVMWLILLVAIIGLLVLLIFSVFSSRARNWGGRKLVRPLSDAFWRGNRKILTLWGLGYLTFLLINRTIVWVDPLGPRLGSPGIVPLVAPILAFLMYAVGAKRRTVLVWAGVFVVLGLILGARLSAQPVRADLDRRLAESERFRWLAENTTERDLLIGDHLQPIPFFYPDRTALNFYYFPVLRPTFSYDQLASIVERFGRDYDHVYFAPLRQKDEEEDVRHKIGPLVADINAGKTDQYPALKFKAELEDGFVYEIDRTALPSAGNN